MSRQDEIRARCESAIRIGEHPTGSANRRVLVEHDIPWLLEQLVEATDVVDKLMDTLHSMPCSAEDFIGSELYRRVARVGGWEDELDEEDE